MAKDGLLAAPQLLMSPLPGLLVSPSCLGSARHSKRPGVGVGGLLGALGWDIFKLRHQAPLGNLGVVEGSWRNEATQTLPPDHVSREEEV